jgi:hypothetical protein
MPISASDLGRWRSEDAERQDKEKQSMSPLTRGRRRSSELDQFANSSTITIYAAHQNLREAGPAVWLQPLRRLGDGPLSARQRRPADPDTYCSRRGVGVTDFAGETLWRAPSLLLEADPPDTSLPRRAIATVISPNVPALCRMFLRWLVLKGTS